MGANNSTRRVSFESDENDNITVVKGIRLSENVIKRMQEPTEPKQHHHTPSSTSSTTQTPTPPPLLKEVPPPFDLITSLPSPVVPVLPSAPSASERGTAPPSQRVAEQPAAEPLSPASVTKPVTAHESGTAAAQAKRAAVRENLHQTVIRERIATEDEKLRAQLFAKQLEAKEADLKKQDAFYREQVARLEERSTQFYKVTTENYHKAADQVNAKCRRYEVNPVCADLQGQILACYKENAGRTLNCSNIAALYLQCVNNAKEVGVFNSTFSILKCFSYLI
uniref:Coiled-coil-helix-coiled-coil-helix domain containing 3a n=1 Tax=Oryzias sinensis TaxID=183150 RepID=A0A8C7Z4Y3_9TELE